jgi:hypothetical protein
MSGLRPFGSMVDLVGVFGAALLPNGEGVAGAAPKGLSVLAALLKGLLFAGAAGAAATTERQRTRWVVELMALGLGVDLKL